MAAPLEHVLRGTTGVRRLTSLSLADGRCLLRLDLDPKADRRAVRAEAQRRLAQHEEAKT